MGNDFANGPGRDHHRRRKDFGPWRIPVLSWANASARVPQQFPATCAHTRFRPGHAAASTTNMKILDIPSRAVAVSTSACARGTDKLVVDMRCHVAVPAPAQILHRSRFGGVRRLWKTLNAPAKATWNTDTQDTRSRTRLNKKLQPPRLFDIRQSQYDPGHAGAPARFHTQPGAKPSPPTWWASWWLPTPAACPSSSSASPPSGQRTSWSFGAAPRSAGSRSLTHFVILGRLPAAEGGYSHITKLYINRFWRAAGSARGCSSARGRCATAGWTSPRRPTPSSRQHSLSIGDAGAKLGGPNTPSR